MLEHDDWALIEPLTSEGARPVNSTPQPSSAAREHFADAERILAALPLVKRGADRERHVQVALVHATLAIAAILADDDGHTR